MSGRVLAFPFNSYLKIKVSKIIGRCFFLKLRPIFISNFISICTSNLPQLCPNFAQRDYARNFAFCPNHAQVLPQLGRKYVSAGYYSNIAFKNS